MSLLSPTVPHATRYQFTDPSPAYWVPIIFKWVPQIGEARVNPKKKTIRNHIPLPLHTQHPICLLLLILTTTFILHFFFKLRFPSQYSPLIGSPKPSCASTPTRKSSIRLQRSSANLSRYPPVARYTTEHSLYPSSLP